MNISSHAISRYQERVADIPEADVIAAIYTPAVRTAMAIGACFVKLGSGHRIVIEGKRVVTVLPVDHSRGLMSLARDPRRMPQLPRST